MRQDRPNLTMHWYSKGSRYSLSTLSIFRRRGGTITTTAARRLATFCEKLAILREEGSCGCSRPMPRAANKLALLRKFADAVDVGLREIDSLTEFFDEVFLLIIWGSVEEEEAPEPADALRDNNLLTIEGLLLVSGA